MVSRKTKNAFQGFSASGQRAKKRKKALLRGPFYFPVNHD
jgi:hypothetical protein